MSAQTPGKRTNYKLLWKISGKGLKSPSYIFGTMHVQDNRAFDFSDSVLLKISECKAFSLEVHPDSIVKALLPIMIGQARSGKNKFKELLNEKEYKEIDSLMQKRTGLSLDKLKTPTMARMFLEKRFGKKEKSTFLDAYLYNIARRQGKSIVGIENAKDQLSVLDNFSADDFRRALLDTASTSAISMPSPFTSMISLYYNGDIDALRNYIKDNPATTADYYNQLITQRNLGMAVNIRKEIHKQSTFFAVGAGHLAGDEGLIHLLQREGYTVQVVKPTFTGLAKKYKYEKLEEPWYTYTSSQGAYSVTMPAKPMELKIDSIALTFQTYVDIGTPVVFQTTYIPLGGQFRGKSPKYALDKLVERMGKGRLRMDKVTRIEVQGLEGREIISNQGGAFVRMQILLRGDMVYMLQASPQRDVAFSADAEKFFHSFRTLEVGKTEWKDFTVPQGAFTVRLPSDVKSQVIKPDPEKFGGRYTLNIFHATDQELSETFVVRYNDFPSNLASEDDSAYYASIAVNMVEAMQGKNMQQHEAVVQGLRGSEFTFDVGESSKVKGRVVLRGGRTYLLLATGPNNGAVSNVDNFINSLRFNPYSKPQLKEFEFPSHHLKIILPASFPADSVGYPKPDDSRDSGYVEYAAVDGASGINYLMTVDRLSDYDHYDSEEDFFTDQNSRYEDDSVVSRTLLHDKKFFGQQLKVTLAKSNAVLHEKLLIYGQTIYRLLVRLPADADPSLATNFFASLKVPEQKETWSLFTDKTAKILNDLSAKDTLVSQKASRYLPAYDFKPAALTALYEALGKSYADDAKESNTREKLFTVLNNVHDGTTIDFIKRIYSTLPDTSDWKADALEVLTSMRTHASSQAFIELFEKEEKKKDFAPYQLLHPYSDSLQLLNSTLPRVLKQLPKFEYAYYALRLTREAIDSNALDATSKAKVFEIILALAQEKVKTIASVVNSENAFEQDSYYEGIANILMLTPATETIKSIFVAMNNPLMPDTRIVTTKFFLKNNMKVATADLDAMATDPLYRIPLYDLLKTFGQEKLYPPKLLSQEKFAEGALYEYMNYEDGIPEHIKLVETRAVRYKDARQNLYVYKYQYPDDNTWYVAVSGPFPEKIKHVPDQGDYTYASYEEFESKKLNEILKGLLDESVELLK
ncbi:TraB/GumN family protein [Chryseolinea lacunae]|uniref:TraB/GumN family protein n=1 Tax=Chryseolinea lacunae TaxID=2801331 RepID=UPI001F290D65|nr:TraB/GumN family protein [Chryseolinea lacunae]